MKLTNGDYIVLDLARSHLAKVVSAEKPYQAILEKDREGEFQKLSPIEFKMSEVLANLGRSPKAGSVHGVKVEPLFRTEESKFFGVVRIYQDMNDERYSAFRKYMVAFVKTIKQKRLDGAKMELEVRPVSGKYAGYYKHRPKQDADILCVRPNEVLDGLQYVFAHEYGHSIHNRMMPRNIWLRWIKQYHNHISITAVDDAELVQIREEIEGVRSVAEYLRDCTDDTKPVIRACLKYISQVHGLSKHHIEAMLGSDESLENIWPSAIELSDKDMVISEYAEKSPEEFFAECFAFHFLGRILPKALVSLMEKTLSNLVHPKGN